MAIIIYGIRNCETMRKAFAWLDEHDVAYDFHDYKKAGITKTQLTKWCCVAGWEIVLNRAGSTFRKLMESEKKNLTQEKAIALMMGNPSMVKRPIIENDDALEVGFRPERYAALFQK